MGSVLFLASSTVLLAAWFRYICLLILRVGSTADYAAAVACANALRFPEIQQRLAHPDAARPAHLDDLRRALDRDYTRVTALIRYGAQFRRAGDRAERRLLMLDFQILRARYAISRRLSVRRCHRTLEEMVCIVQHFACVMGECAAAH